MSPTDSKGNLNTFDSTRRYGRKGYSWFLYQNQAINGCGVNRDRKNINKVIEEATSAVSHIGKLKTEKVSTYPQ